MAAFRYLAMIAAGLAAIAPAHAESAVIRPVVEKSSFQIALEGPLPVLVLFQGRNCAACRAVEHWIDQMSGEIVGKVDMVSLDVDDNPYAKKEFGVEGTPTMLIFRNGEQIGAKVGATEYADLREWIETTAGIAPAPAAISSGNPR